MTRHILRKIWEKAEFRLLKSQQSTSGKLRAIFRDRHRIDVGLYSYGCFDQWRMPGPMRIGRWCSIASTVRVAPINHPMNAITTHPALYETAFGVVDTPIGPGETLVIEDDVWIGHNAILLPGCKSVGRGAVVGAGAIVTRDVPAYTIVAGNPAKPIRRRFDDAMIEALEASGWWKLDAPDLRRLYTEDRSLLLEPTVAALRRWTEEQGRIA